MRACVWSEGDGMDGGEQVWRRKGEVESYSKAEARSDGRWDWTERDGQK